MLHFHIDGLIYGLQPHGGISRVFTNLIEALSARQDCEVTLYLPPNLRASQRLPNRTATVVYPETIDFRPRRIFESLNRSRASRAMNRMWSSVRNGVYLSSHYSTYPGIELPQLQIIQDTIYERFPDLFASNWDLQHVKDKFACIKAASCIVTPSVRSLEDTREFYDIDNKACFVVPYACDDNFRKTPVQNDLAVFREQHKLHEPFILHTGSRYLHKNFGALMAAYSQWDGKSEYMLVSVGAGRFSPVEASLARGLGIAHRITVIPSLNDQQLVTAYHAASAFVFPSLYEGFGFPVIEAIACGTPAAISNASCLPEVGGGTPWYFDPYNQKMMLVAIEQALMARRTDCDRIKNGKREILNRTWGDVAKKVADIARSIEQ